MANDSIIEFIVESVKSRYPEFYREVMFGVKYEDTPSDMKPDDWDDGWDILAHTLVMYRDKNKGGD